MAGTQVPISFIFGLFILLNKNILLYVRSSVKHMLNKNSQGLLKKGAAKQSRIKNIVWYLRWLVRTRVDIRLRPSGLERTRTDIKLRPIGLVRSYKD